MGDDEQVTPVAVGMQSQEVANLIKVFLQGVPHKELYDGETSVYELAQIAFGGVIRLTEHFRCAPSIIAFSNSLAEGPVETPEPITDIPPPSFRHAPVAPPRPNSSQEGLGNLPGLFPPASVATKTPAAEGKFEVEIVSVLRTRGRLDTESLVIELAKKHGLDDLGRRQIRSALDRLEAKGAMRRGANYVTLSTA